MYYIVNDVETSGRHRWYHDVISCGLVVLNQDLDIIDKFYEECCPWNVKSFDHETVDIHGMTLNYLMNQQSSYHLSISILHFLNKYREKEHIVYRPFVYHALNRFDFNFMDNLFLKNGLEFSYRKMFHWQHSFSTIRMGRQLGYTENGLNTWSDRLGERFIHHKAIDDAVLGAKVFKYLLSKGAKIEDGFEIKKSEIISNESDAESNQHKSRKNKKSNEENEDICNSSMLSYLQA